MSDCLSAIVCHHGQRQISRRLYRKHLSGHRSVQDTSFRSRDRRNPGGVETRDGRANSTAVVVLVVDIPGSETFLGGPRVALLGWPLENH